MQRPHRHRRTFNEPGHAHALTFSCYQGYPFLAPDRTRRWLANAINVAREKLEFQVWAYVFMPEHAHVLVFPGRRAYDIAKIRQAIKAPVAKRAIRFLEDHASHWIPKITRRRGEKVERLFWQSGGGYDRNLIEPATVLATIDYIHMNPVRRRLVDLPTDWTWSSASWFAGKKDVPLQPDPIPADWLN
jgi:putative transposase